MSEEKTKNNGKKTIAKNEKVEMIKAPSPEEAKNVLEMNNKYVVIRGKDGKARVIPKTNRKICIMGYAPASRDLAPFKDKSWEIWGENDLYRFVPRMDLLFQIHDIEAVKRHNRTGEHYEWLKKSKIPVVMQDHYPEIPASIKMPFDEMNKIFVDYWTNSISYMIAFAIMMGPKAISLYGIDMARGSEHNEQRPSVEYFIGLAKGLGIEVIIPAECDLLKAWVRYGYNDGQLAAFHDKAAARIAELNNHRVSKLQEAEMFRQKMQQSINAAHSYAGALDNTQYWKRNIAIPETPVGAETEDNLNTGKSGGGNTITQIHSDRE